MSEELIDIYDENLNKIGTTSRGEAHKSGAWHRSIHVWIVRPVTDGFALFQKRGREKKLFPNLLDISAAGHYQSGEDARQGVREILEELGILVKYEDLIPLGIKVDLARIGDIINREFCDVFLLSRNESPGEYDLDPSEVEGLVQIKIEDGLRLFSGETEEALAEGIEWSKEDNVWNNIKTRVQKSDFIPRIDQYYYKVFIMGRSLIAGDKYLAI